MNKLIVILFLLCTTFKSNSQTVDFTYSNTTGLYCSPSIVKFTHVATGSPIGYVWTFGNNAGSNQEDPVTIYTRPGNYTVKLLVIYRRYTKEVTKNIVINPGITARFTMDKNNICTPGVIKFKANIPEQIATYEWNFGDGSPTVTTNRDTISHYFANYGTQTVSFKALAPSGCSGQSFNTVTIKRPGLTGIVNKKEGCIPALVNFKAFVNPLTSTVVSSYRWDFDDGSPIQITSTREVNHTYTSVGKYVTKVSITTTEGCTQDYAFEEIAFGTPPTQHNAFAEKLEFCGSESPGFHASATNANKYLWDFSDQDSVSTMDTVLPHRFKSLGIKNISVTPYFNGCPGTPVQLQVNVIGTIAGYRYANTCENKKEFSFVNQSQGHISSLNWSFSDGTPDISQNNLIHTYPDTGTFLTRLVVNDNITGCSDTYGVNIYTANPKLLNPDQWLCRNSQTTFTIDKNYNNPKALYDWNVVGIRDSSSNANPLILGAKLHGLFNTNWVIIKNGPQYCPDTIQLTNNLLVRGPIVNFDAPNEICVLKPFAAENKTISYVNTDQITQWKWNYGLPDEADQTVYQPQSYQYPYWGTFSIKLFAKDQMGCEDSLAKNIIARDIPFLRVIPDADTLCAGKSSRLIAFHNDPITWTPSTNISCTTCDTVFVSPQVSTIYQVSSTNQFNCTVTEKTDIHVYERFNAKAEKEEFVICNGESVALDVSPKNKFIVWTPSTGLSNVSFNPSVKPEESINYVATLTDSGKCFNSSVNIKVIVKSLPLVNAGNDKVLSYQSPFTLTPNYSSNVRTYEWSPAVLLDCKDCANPSGTAVYGQTFTVKVTSDSGCVAKDDIAVYVECKGANLLLPTAFTPNGDLNNDKYFPITRGIQKINSFVIYNRLGQIVYEARNFIPNDRIHGWDGKLRGLFQDAGSYVYVLEAICESGQSIHKNGSFVLIR